MSKEHNSAHFNLRTLCANNLKAYSPQYLTVFKDFQVYFRVQLHTQPDTHMPTQKHYLKVKEPIHSFPGKVYASLNSKSRTFLCNSDEDFPPGENGNPLILCMVNLIWMLHSFAFFQFVSSFLSFPFF